MPCRSHMVWARNDGSNTAARSERFALLDENTLLSKKPPVIIDGLNIHDPARMPTGS